MIKKASQVQHPLLIDPNKSEDEMHAHFWIAEREFRKKSEMIDPGLGIYIYTYVCVCVCVWAVHI